MKAIKKNRNGIQGIYRTLFKAELWVTEAALFTALNLIIFGGRFIEDGFAYNTSLCAQFGDNALIIVILIACSILKKTMYVPEILISRIQSSALLFPCFIIGAVVNSVAVSMTSHPPKWVDMVHNLVVVPVFLFLFVTLMPITFKRGSRKQMAVTILLIAIWAGLGLYDYSANRLDQPIWMITNPFK